MNTMIAERPAASVQERPAVRSAPPEPKRPDAPRPPYAAALLPYGLSLHALQPR